MDGCVLSFLWGRSDFAQLCENLSEGSFNEVFAILERRPEYVEGAVVAEGGFCLSGVTSKVIGSSTR